MSGELLRKGLLAALIGGVLAFELFYQNRRDRRILETGDRSVRYLGVLSGWLLPLFMVYLVLAGLLFLGARNTARMVLSTFFDLLLSLGGYYLILLPLLPFLRRHFSARACAALWLIPGFLYMTQQSYMKIPEPLLVIPASGNLVWKLFGIWLLGALAVFLWKLLSHLAFRRRVLRDARPVTDTAVLGIWEEELHRANFRKPRFRLVISGQVSTPLTVGLFQSRMRVVLPQRSYAPEDLSLIFRHELIHIGREDSWTKFFLSFCTALCWFNPFMWVAMGKSAEDLELSCDEAVLTPLEAGPDGMEANFSAGTEASPGELRRRYAELILQTAADSRGFTTCLSASAASLRYRLRRILHPGPRRSGALLVGLVFFVLCMTCGHVALAYDPNTGAERIYGGEEAPLRSLSYLSQGTENRQQVACCREEEALFQYLSRLELYHLTGNYSFPDSRRECFFLYDMPQGTLGVLLRDHTVKVAPLWTSYAETYYLPEATDWAYLDTLITAAAGRS